MAALLLNSIGIACICHLVGLENHKAAPESTINLNNVPYLVVPFLNYHKHIVLRLNFGNGIGASDAFESRLYLNVFLVRMICSSTVLSGFTLIRSRLSYPGDGHSRLGKSFHIPISRYSSCLILK